MKENVKGALFIITSMLIFGFNGTFIRILNVPIIFLIFFNFLFSGVILFIYQFFKDKSKLIIKNHLWLLILLAIVNLGNNGFYFQAIIKTTISNAAFTHYTAPIFVAILAPYLLKEKLEKFTIPAILLSSLGMILILYNNFSLSSNDFIGIMFGTASGIMYALVIILIKHLSKNLSPITIIAYFSLFIAAMVAPFSFNSNVLITPKLMMLIFLFAILFGITGVLLHIQGIKRVKSQHAGTLAYIEIVAATTYAAIFLKEIPGLVSILGGSLIVFGGYLTIMKQK